MMKHLVSSSHAPEGEIIWRRGRVSPKHFKSRKHLIKLADTTETPSQNSTPKDSPPTNSKNNSPSSSDNSNNNGDDDNGGGGSQNKQTSGGGGDSGGGNQNKQTSGGEGGDNGGGGGSQNKQPSGGGGGDNGGGGGGSQNKQPSGGGGGDSGGGGGNQNKQTSGGGGGQTQTQTPVPPNPSGSQSPPRAIGPPSPPKPAASHSNSNDMLIPIVVAASVAAGLFILIALVVCFACKNRRKKKQLNEMKNYMNNQQANKDGGKNYAVHVPLHAINSNKGHGQHVGNSPYRAGNVPHVTNNKYHQGNSQYNRNKASDNDQLSNLPPPPGANRLSPGPGPPPPPPLDNTVEGSYNSSGPYGPILPPPPPNLSPATPPRFSTQSNFSYEELSLATEGFSKTRLLGQGGFGFVYKGLLANGKEIAVKTLKSRSGQGEREFQAEVEIISRVHHRHLVSLVGYCIAADQRMLVYEYVPNNSLDFHLHAKGRPTMEWSTRVKIALGSARGLAYLHEDCHPRIIHRDIKSSNILLDNSWEAKVADFGLAKLNSGNDTHVSTRVMGTFGYLAPEYASSGKLTEKSDIFSFGVMLLELITGRQPVDPSGKMEDSLVDWARPLCVRALDDGNYESLADPHLENNYPAYEMARMVACAATSIRHSARRRPKMSKIVRALEGDVSLEDLKDGRIGQISMEDIPSAAGSSLAGSVSMSDLESLAYGQDLKDLKKMEAYSGYVTSEFGLTSEYGRNPSISSSESDMESRELRTMSLPIKEVPQEPESKEHLGKEIPKAGQAESKDPLVKDIPKAWEPENKDPLIKENQKLGSPRTRTLW